MRIVATQAGLFVHQWPVYSVLVEGFVEHIVMTPTTKPNSFLFGLEGILCGGFLMALVTHPFGDR